MFVVHILNIIYKHVFFNLSIIKKLINPGTILLLNCVV